MLDYPAEFIVGAALLAIGITVFNWFAFRRPKPQPKPPTIDYEAMIDGCDNSLEEQERWNKHWGNPDGSLEERERWDKYWEGRHTKEKK